MAGLTITPLHPSIGAEISGVDLSRPLDAGTRTAIAEAPGEHLALVLHDQPFTPDQSFTPNQYLQAATIFGPPKRQHYSRHDMPDYHDIGPVWHRNGQPPAERWHPVLV